MKKYFILMILSAAVFAVDMEEPVHEITQQDRTTAYEVSRDIRHPGYRMRLRTNIALDALVRVAAGELERNGYPKQAARIEREWAGWAAFDDLGDHAPLSRWLTGVYDELQALLGDTLMEITHLVDIKVLNYSIPVVFHPCTFPMDGIAPPRAKEYASHFVAYGIDYKGAYAPVVTYWASYAGCVLGTGGSGFVVVCGIAALAPKWVMKTYVAPPISERVIKNCFGEEGV